MSAVRVVINLLRRSLGRPLPLTATILAVVLVTLVPLTAGATVDAAYAIGTKVVLTVFAVALLTLLGWWKRTGFATVPRAADLPWLAPPAVLVVAVLLSVVWAGPAEMQPWGAVAFGLVALGTGFSEEALFRGAIVETLRPWGWRPALLGSAVAFALIHLAGLVAGADVGATFAQVFLYALPWGIAFAGLRLTGRSIWPLVTIHAVNNFAGYLTNGSWVNAAPDVGRYWAAGMLQGALLLGLVAYSLWFLWRPRSIWRERGPLASPSGASP